MRQIVALIVGVAMLGGGLYLLYTLFFNASTIHFMLVSGGGFLVFLGGYVLWEILRNWNYPLPKQE
jgi:hypothetical protein